MKLLLLAFTALSFIYSTDSAHAEDSMKIYNSIYIDFDGDGINDNYRDNDGNGIPDDFENKNAENKAAPGILGQSLNESLSNNTSTKLYLNNREAFGAREFHVRCHSNQRIGFTFGIDFGVGNGIGLGNIANGCAGGVCGI
ncbi:MAG: hypothetical protein ABIE07_03410 [Candidatus Zixiibacteriota bacterium]